MNATIKALRDQFGLELFESGGGCREMRGDVGLVNYVIICDLGGDIPESPDERIDIYVARTREQMQDATAWEEGAIETIACNNLRDALVHLDILRNET